MIGQSWLLSSKLARKAGYWQTAYSAMLQARQTKNPFVYLESVKLTKAGGESLRALQELDGSIKLAEIAGKGVIDLTEDGEIKTEDKMIAKVGPFGSIEMSIAETTMYRHTLFAQGGCVTWSVSYPPILSTRSCKAPPNGKSGKVAGSIWGSFKIIAIAALRWRSSEPGE